MPYHSDTKAIGFWGARSGCGTTSLAVNVAYLISQNDKEDVLLVDPDIHAGDAGLIVPCGGYGELARIFESASDYALSSQQLQQSIHPVNGHLHLLNDLTDTPYHGAFYSHELGRLASQQYSTQIWDIPAFSSEQVLAPLFDELDTCVLVMEPGITGLRDMQRKLKLLKAYPKLELLLVVNQTRPTANNFLTDRNIEDLLTLPVAMTMPFCRKAICPTSSNSRMLCFSTAKNRKALRELAGLCLSPRQLKPQTSSLWQRFWGLNNRPLVATQTSDEWFRSSIAKVPPPS